jgi:acyl-CoA reductase-like NAD-dependent aldehyde dehydrogenase
MTADIRLRAHGFPSRVAGCRFIAVRRLWSISQRSRVRRLPFGGHRASGLGTGGIGYSMRERTQSKLVIIRGR